MTMTEARRLLREQVVGSFAQELRKEVRETRAELAVMRGSDEKERAKMLLLATDAFIEYLEAWK